MTEFTRDILRNENNQDAVRINKFLSDAGICSRREADLIIDKGLVMVDGTPAVKGQKISPQQVVTYKGRVIEREKELIILAFNKPVGVECTTAQDVADNIIDYINYPSRIFPVGRLDKRSSGLILLTNTGDLSDKILRGSNYHEKEYDVQVDEKVTDDFIRQMSEGVWITLEDGKKEVRTRPCRIRKTGEHSFRIILTQGLNRQIRRMCAALGFHVKTLNRIRIMNIMLGNLKTGTYRNLTDPEIRELITNLKIT